MEHSFIRIIGARENNLKNISVTIPKNKITVFTGISGSGKSSLVFDTLAAESQRLLNETYSSYIQHQLPHYGKPNVDAIENLSVAIRIDQKRIKGNARSTVGTLTDIYSLLRLLFSRAGTPFIGISNVFSFNHPKGMCPHCEGLGKIKKPDINQLIDKTKSLNEGAIRYPAFEVGSWRWSRYAYSGLFDVTKKLQDYSEKEWEQLLYSRMKLQNPPPEYPKSGEYEGLIPRFERSFLKRDSKEITGKNFSRFQEVVTQEICPECKGTRLNPTVLNCRIQGKNIADCCLMQIDELSDFIKTLYIPSLSPILDQLSQQLESLLSIGLGYLTLHRETSTLSGGEAQRIKLVRHLGSSLTDLLYILDEPSVGLHPNDVSKLNHLLIGLKNKGNTVLIIEHDPDIMAIADHIIDIGPGAGKKGGKIIYEGVFSSLKKADTPTGRYLAQKHSLKKHCRTSDEFLSLEKINLHNLKNVSVSIPRQVITTLTGVAGSGKSSLIEALSEKYPDLILIDQSVLRGSKRSNLATYTGILDRIRYLFAKENQAPVSLFSSNSGGACPECKGLGILTTDLAFMDPVKSICENCGGSGYKPEVLPYLLNKKNIVEILHLTVSEALSFFTESEILSPLQHLFQVGLDYLTLRQPLNTLSGGERQRLKLADNLKKTGTIYVFDEPTTGLHGTDIYKLLILFNQLVDEGKNTVVLVEHNLDIISQSDWMIDLGPEAGNKGGQILFEGYPKNSMHIPLSLTGKYLKKYIS